MHSKHHTISLQQSYNFYTLINIYSICITYTIMASLKYGSGCLYDYTTQETYTALRTNRTSSNSEESFS